MLLRSLNLLPHFACRTLTTLEDELRIMNPPLHEPPRSYCQFFRRIFCLFRTPASLLRHSKQALPKCPGPKQSLDQFSLGNPISCHWFLADGQLSLLLRYQCQLDSILGCFCRHRLAPLPSPNLIAGPAIAASPDKVGPTFLDSLRPEQWCKDQPNSIRTSARNLVSFPRTSGSGAMNAFNFMMSQGCVTKYLAILAGLVRPVLG